MYLIIILIILISRAVCAATYFVDAKGGSDGNNGLSREKAWRSIKKVKETTFQPGDEICFKRGEVFSDSILFVYSSGSEGKPIVFRDYGDPHKPLPVITYSHNFCIWMRDRQHLVFQNLEVAGGGEAVFELKQSAVGKTRGIVIRDCVIRGAQNGIWVDTAEGGLIEGCEIYNCGTGFSSHDPGFTVRNCRIHDNTYGISVGTYNTLIEGNEIYDNEVGIQYGFGYGTCDVAFRGNLIRDNKRSGIETWYDVVAAGTISYSVIMRNGGDGVLLKNGVSGIMIRNNFIYGNGGNGVHLAGEGGKTPRSVVITNNILLENRGLEMKVAPGVSGLQSDCNCIYHPADPLFMEWQGSRCNWADWKGQSHQDEHSLSQDPLVLNKAAGDVRLASNSPCINTGCGSGLTGKDFYGNAVPRGRIDIGVFEMQFGYYKTDKPAAQ